jgi:hypothetical protein
MEGLDDQDEDDDPAAYLKMNNKAFGGAFNKPKNETVDSSNKLAPSMTSDPL